MSRLNPYALLIVAWAVSGCMSFGGSAEPVPAKHTALELRQMQTRTYEDAEMKTALRASINVLQDLGFTIRSADGDLGILMAEKWSNVPHTAKEVKEARKKGKTLAESLVLECTLNVSPFGTASRVRTTFQEKWVSGTGGVLKARLVEEARVYQEFFSNLDKGIFFEREGV